MSKQYGIEDSNRWVRMMILLLATLMTQTVLAESLADKRLLLAPEVIAQLDAGGMKQPIVLPDLGIEKDIWLHFYGSIRRGKETSILVNQQWISKPTKVHGILISPNKVSDMGALSVTLAGESIWLAPGQGVRLRDRWVE